MKIVFFGDSITDMSRNRDSNADEVWTYGSGYPMFVASALYREDPTKYRVVNRGIGGDRSAELYARIDRDVWNEKPDILSILVGINDVWHAINSQSGIKAPRFEMIYDMMLQETHVNLPHAKIILCEPFVLKGRATAEQFDTFMQIYAYADIVRKLAIKHNAYFLPLQEKFDEAANKFGAENYLYDGVHTDVAGATLIADEWIKLFKTI